MDTAELYLPSSNTSCLLPRLPAVRSEHTSSPSGLLGGGAEFSSYKSFLQWIPETGSWETFSLRDHNGRYNGVSWTPVNSSNTYLMGGKYRTTTTLLNPGESTQMPGFRLKVGIE